jgi:hypothetical protein
MTRTNIVALLLLILIMPIYNAIILYFVWHDKEEIGIWYYISNFSLLFISILFFIMPEDVAVNAFISIKKGLINKFLS